MLFLIDIVISLFKYFFLQVSDKSPFIFFDSEVAEAAEVNEAGDVSKAWKITTVDFRVFQVLEFNNLRTGITFF